MFSKILVVAAATVQTTSALHSSQKWAVTHADTLSCSDCIIGGYTFCLNTGWFEDLSAKSGIPTTICCQDKTSCPKIFDQKYACTYYPTNGRYFDTANTKMPSGFGDNLGYALASCPTKQSICGASKFIAVDAISKASITVKGSDLIVNETCTWILKSKCKAPYFKIARENTMSDGKIKVNVLEWREATVLSSSTIEDFRQDVNFAMPLQNITWADTSNNSGVKGRLGHVSILPENNVKLSGEWIQYQMNSRRAEFKDYNTNKVTYDTKKAIYNGSLRIESAPGATNWYDFALPPSATTKQGTFTFPPYPFMPYVPPLYNGPTFEGNTPYTGYGQATETLLGITAGNQAIDNYQVKGFGTIGFTNTLT